MLFSWSTLRGVLPDIVVAGDEGTLHLWPQASYIDLYPANGTLIKRALTFVRPYALQEKLMLPRFERIRIRVPEREGSGYLGEFREFLGAVVEERDVVSPPIDARRDLEVVLRAYDSLTSRGEAAIAPLP
jgi:predicted dehydrogenase